MTTYPDPQTWTHFSPCQIARVERSFAILRQRQVPVYDGPLICSDDDDQEHPQSAADVARRLIVLWAVELRAEGMPQAESLEMIEKFGAASSVSPNERAFLDNEDPDPEECQSLVWRLESIWVLLWALGLRAELPWPSGMCDVPTLANLMATVEDNPDFIATARLRPISELLDAQDLHMRLQWAIRDALLHGSQFIPEDLDWSIDGENEHVTMCAAALVVQERYYTLNWLINFMEPKDWDSVDTPT